MQINLVVAIDFTASNGDPLSLDSLHYSRYIHMRLCKCRCMTIPDLLQYFVVLVVSNNSMHQYALTTTFVHIFLYSPDPRHRNPYQEAITSVCSVLDAYDTDKMYPVYGFGAKVSIIMFLCVLCS